MKNSLSSLKKKFLSKYSFEDRELDYSKSTNINVLLNRVRLDQKKESVKKIVFLFGAFFVIISFGILIF